MEINEGGPKFESTPVDNQTPEPAIATGQEPEGSTPEQQTEPSPVQEKQPYTLEELQAINQTGGKVDTSRLPDFLLPIYKQFQGDYTRSKQALEEERNRLEAERAEVIRRSQQPQQPPTLLQEFDQNPQAVLQRLDQAYQEKAESDPFEAQKILHIRSMLQDRLIGTLAQGFYGTQARAQEDGLRVAAFQSVQSAIPEYGPELRDKLLEFSLNDLGYSQDEIEYMTDPAMLARVFGPQKAIKIAQANLKTVYNLYKTKVGAQAVRRNTPTRVESAGTGFPTQTTKWDYDTILAEKEKKVIT